MDRSLYKAATAPKSRNERRRSHHPNQKDYSFSTVLNTYSRIDMFLTSHKILSRLKACSHLSATLSDHNPIKMEMELGPPEPASHRWRFRVIYWKTLNLLLLLWMIILMYSWKLTRIPLLIPIFGKPLRHIWEGKSCHMGPDKSKIREKDSSN